MKIETIFFESINKEIIYYIGRNSKENFSVIDMGKQDDIWIHVKDESSCHVVIYLPDERIERTKLKQIIKKGCLLCKENTNKLKNVKKVEMIYTQIKYVTKTNVEGCVITENTKTFLLC
jgi:predicted ribosome quality control (RQC) complex YloA/Tae2 family protein